MNLKKEYMKQTKRLILYVFLKKELVFPNKNVFLQTIKNKTLWQFFSIKCNGVTRVIRRD
jgi:hypothetical protein